MATGQNTLIQNAIGTEAEWLDCDPVLAPGQLGIIEDTCCIVFGNGVDKFSDLCQICGGETVTTLVDNNDGTFTYTNEDGFPVTIDVCKLIEDAAILPTLTETPAGSGTYVFDDGKGNTTTFSINEIDMDINDIQVNNSEIIFTAEDGTTTTVDVCKLVAQNCNATMVLNPDGTYTHTANDGTITNIDICNIVAKQCNASLVVNPDGSVTHTANDGTITTIPAPVYSTLTNTITGNQIGTHTSGDGTIVNIFETITELVDNGDGSFTYVSEDGTETTIPAPVCAAIVDDAVNCEFTFTDCDGNDTTINYAQLEPKTIYTLDGNQGVEEIFWASSLPAFPNTPYVLEDFFDGTQNGFPYPTLYPTPDSVNTLTTFTSTDIGVADAAPNGGTNASILEACVYIPENALLSSNIASQTAGRVFIDGVEVHNWDNPANSQTFLDHPITCGLHNIKLFIFDPLQNGSFNLRWSFDGGATYQNVPSDNLFLEDGSLSMGCKTIYTDKDGNEFEDDKTTPYVAGVTDSECPIKNKVDLSSVCSMIEDKLVCNGSCPYEPLTYPGGTLSDGTTYTFTGGGTVLDLGSGTIEHGLSTVLNVSFSAPVDFNFTNAVAPTGRVVWHMNATGTLTTKATTNGSAWCLTEGSTTGLIQVNGIEALPLTTGGVDANVDWGTLESFGVTSVDMQSYQWDSYNYEARPKGIKCEQPICSVIEESCKRIEVLETASNPTLVREDIIVGFASGFQDGTTTIQSRNSIIARTAVGKYTVTFASPHPDGAAYEVLFGIDEDASLDVSKISVVEGSRTANGFDLCVTDDDNGAAADLLVDEPWSFEVLYEKSVITDIIF